MFYNYFKIAWRNLANNKIFSGIKILGLSIGLTVCMLIFLYTKDEVSYDRFHKNKEQLYRITQNLQAGDNPVQTIGITAGVFGEAFAKEIPEVQEYVRINSVTIDVKKKNNDVLSEQGMAVDDNFFEVFTFQLLHGDKSTALIDPHAVVVSKKMAAKYFGNEEAIGQVIQIKRDAEFKSYTVTAIAEDLPQNSSIKADIFFPIRYSLQSMGNPWLGGNLITFLLLSPQANTKSVESKMQAILHKNTKDFVAQAAKEQGIIFKATLSLQPLTDIHLSTMSGPGMGMSDGSNPVYAYILTCIAIFILVIACINFINLAVSQSLKRSKEIGIRKVVGGTRRQLIKQFLTESFLVSLMAFAIAIFLTIAILPYFNELANKKLSFAYLSDWFLCAAYLLLLFVTTFVSGFYPSLVLSAFQPVKVLYGRQKLMSRNYLSKGLTVLQFALTVFLVIGTIAINSQLNFLLHKDLGYDSKNLVLIDLPHGDQSHQLPALFKNELVNNSNIVNVAARNSGRNTSGVKAEGKQIIIDYNEIDDRFLPTFKISIIAGRNFSPTYPADSSSSVIVNESFAKEAGWSVNNAIGKSVQFMDEQNRAATIIGVIKDYHFSSLKEKIAPELFSMGQATNYGQVWIKIKPGDVPQTLSLLESTFKKVVPYFPYSYQFMDDINARNYETETKWKQIISIASVLFIFISCIGLLGLVILSIEQRAKEIGIRKVLGAAVSRIIVLISKELIVLISISFVVAVPVAYYFINKWLQGFAYRIAVSWWMFALAGAAIIGVVLFTISFRTIKAAVANPVKSLRTE